MANDVKIRMFSEIKEDIRDFFRTFPTVLKASRRAVLLFVFFVIVLIVVLHPYDLPWIQAFMKNWPGPHIDIAKAFRSWGDFRDTVTVTLLLFVAGKLFKRRDWRRLAVAFFLSVCLAGVAANAIRFTAGRPRPYLRKVTEDRWHGPLYLYPAHMKPVDEPFRKFQSFPSGHSTTSSAGAAMLLVAAPALGIPLAISAIAVIWSCLYCGVHYATDVTAGMAFGIIFGSLGGLTYRRIRSKALNPKS